MPFLRCASTFAMSAVGLSAILLLSATPVPAHAPVKVPVPLTHLGHVPVTPIHAQLEKSLLAPSHLMHVAPVNPIHAAIDKELLLPSHVMHVPFAPVHSELANVLHPSHEALSVPFMVAPSHGVGIPFDLRLLDYEEAQREKLRSVVTLLVFSERLDARGDFKQRDLVSKQAHDILFSLGKKTILQVGRDEQFIRLHVLKYIFQLG